MPPADAPTPRALGRALLARQHLLDRATGPDARAVPMVHHLVGLQSQNPSSAYLALHARVEGFAPADLSAPMLDRAVGRLALMRDTVHLVTAADAHALHALLAPLLRRRMLTTSGGATLREVDLDALEDRARSALADGPLTARELGDRLAPHFPDRDPGHLALGARGLLPLVQVTPRGVWGRSMTTTWTTADAWFGAAPPPEDPDRAVEDLVRRYLAAFGPATVADVQRWSGLTRVAAVVDRIRSGLVDLGPDERGRPLWDVSDAPRPDPATPAPVRFLPDFDEVLLGHDDRSRIVPPEIRPMLASRNGMPPGTVLVDGLVAGSWGLTRSRADRAQGRREHALLTVTPLRPWSRDERAAVTAEGEVVVRFLADTADDHGVTIV